MSTVTEFGTKAETLNTLRNQLQFGHVLPQVTFTIEDWTSNKNNIVNVIKNTLGCKFPLIIRSSALSEDTSKFSFAGKYTSIPHVKNMQQLVDAIKQV